MFNTKEAIDDLLMLVDADFHLSQWTKRDYEYRNEYFPKTRIIASPLTVTFVFGDSDKISVTDDRLFAKLQKKK